jgi:hypothetical protein
MIHDHGELAAWFGTGLVVVVFAAPVARAHAAEPRRRAIRLVVLLLWVGLLCGLSVMSRWCA